MVSTNIPLLSASPPRVAYRSFAVSVSRIQPLGGSFLRVTFQGKELAHFHFVGLDQRIKLVLPDGETDLTRFPRDVSAQGGDWYAAWRASPEGGRGVLRTYTVRAARPAVNEIDVDFVVHGQSGPATRWVTKAAEGDEILVIGPDVRSLGRENELGAGATGVEFAPGTARRILLAGDETAAPAICGILEALPRKARGQVFIEVATAADILPVKAPGGVAVCWLAREGRPGLDRGQVLERAVRAWVSEMMPAADGRIDDDDNNIGNNNIDSARADNANADGFVDDDDDDVEADGQQLWDVPPANGEHDLYAWLAGESGSIKALRRFLVSDTGLHRSDVAFMGYWRLGRPMG